MTDDRFGMTEVKDEAIARPEFCERCQSATFRSQGLRAKTIVDIGGQRTVITRRFQCTECGKCTVMYPEGVDRHRQSQRLRTLLAMMWTLGLSLRSTSLIMKGFRIAVSHMSIWRFSVQTVTEIHSRRTPGRIRVLGVDATGSRVKGEPGGLVVAVDMRTGQTVATASIAETDVEAMIAWLAPLVEKFEVDTLVTDDLSSYGPIVKALKIDHQRCLFHMRRWAGKRIEEFRESLGPEWHEFLDDLDLLLEERWPDGGHQLLTVYQAIDEPPPKKDEKATPMYKLRLMLIYLSERWATYTLCDRRADVPTTNNRTEYAIGRFKTRQKTMRGLKSAEGRDTVYSLAQSAPLFLANIASSASNS